MSSEKRSQQRKQDRKAVHSNYLHSAAVINADGQEIPITREMIDKACNDIEHEIPVWLSQTKP